MKKFISIFVLALGLSLAMASCSTETDEPAGGTAVEAMAGHWVVVADIIEDGEVYDDPYGIGEWDLYTYNTANNDADQMWISDAGNFWDFTLKTPISLDNMTFACTDVYIYDGDDGPVTCTITDGKVIKNGGKNVNGKPTDAIEFKIEYADDPGTIYYIHGVRYAGF